MHVGYIQNIAVDRTFANLILPVNKYAIDLTALAEAGKIDPVIGRDNEIRRTIRILCRR